MSLRELAKWNVIGLFLQNNGDSPLVDGWHRVSNYDLSTGDKSILGRVYVHRGKIADADAIAFIVPSSDKMRSSTGTHKMSDKPASNKPVQLVLLKGGDAGVNL